MVHLIKNQYRIKAEIIYPYASSVSKSFMNKEKKNINDIKISINKSEQAKISLKKKVSKGIGQRETKTVLKDFTRMISNIS